MIKFGRIIEAAGFKPSDYPDLSNVLINVVDLKNHELETVNYDEKPLFAKNFASEKEKFEKFLKEAEKDGSVSIINMRIQLSESYLHIFFPPTPAPKFSYRRRD